MPVGQRRGIPPRVIIGLVIAGIALVTYFARSSVNPVTGQTQRVALSIEQEIALGLQSAPEMAQQFGGLHPDQSAQARVDRVGNRILDAVPNRGAPYQFEFHLLADPKVINAFALPGGQIFITAALYDKLPTDGQLAGVLGHEIGHVIERHGAEHLAKAQLTQGLTGAAVVAASDPENPSSRQAAMLAMVVGQLINMKYGRDDELESDAWGVRLMAAAGYDPRAQIRVMEVLRDAAGERGSPPEFMSTHPDPGNRIERIQALIAQEFPQGVPADLEP